MTTSLAQHLGATVRALRKARRWPRRELAAATGISERFLADIEAGRGNPSLQRLAELAAALGTTPAALLSAPVSERRDTIALLGLRGAGKSTIGRLLSERLGCALVELDGHVESAAGLTLTELFQLHGEAYFRRLEGEALTALLAEPGPRVLATGGGVVQTPSTFERLQRHTHTVWLQASPEDHWTRVIAQGDTRPMADNAQAFGDLCAILAEREQRYRQAHMIVTTSDRNADEVADELALHFAYLRAEERQ